MSSKAWWGFDLDATIAKFNVGDNKDGNSPVGEPIKPLIRRMKYYLRTGRRVAIVTARVHHTSADPSGQNLRIRAFLEQVLGSMELAEKVDIRCDKDRHMIVLYDDRVEQVIPNKGILVRHELRRAVDALWKIAAGHREPFLVAQEALDTLDEWSLDLASD